MNRYSSNVLTVAFLLCLALGVVEGANADGQSSVCADADDSRYASDEAYAFGLKIQEAVRVRDPAAFFSLVDGELDYGPRRKYAKNKAFHEIFPDSWRAAVLKEKPPCTPYGWRGFDLANGLVKYWPSSIFAVHGWVPEKFPPVPVGWKVKDRLLPPQCFVYMWDSGDNFQEVARLFSVPDDLGAPEFKDFEHNTGKYLGDPIYPFYRASEYSLWKYVDECLFSVNSDQLQISDSTVEYVYPESEGREFLRYTIMADVSPDRCQDLAPNLPGKCLKSYLVDIKYCGGSLGCRGPYTIYGMFQMQDGERHTRERIIFPLKNFKTENLARNFLDSK